MKPLLSQNDIDNLLNRVERGVDAQNLSIKLISPIKMEFRLSVQDSHRDFDWIDLIFEIDGVSDARLLEESQLLHVDMSEGISLINNSCVSGICLGTYNDTSGFRDSTLFILGESLKYKEAPFSA